MSLPNSIAPSLLQVVGMEEKEAPAVHTADNVSPATQDGTPSKPRQAGNGSGRKQLRAAKQLKFDESNTGMVGHASTSLRYHL